MRSPPQTVKSSPGRSRGHLDLTHLIFALQEGHFTQDRNLGLFQPVLGSAPRCLHQLLNLAREAGSSTATGLRGSDTSGGKWRPARSPRA